jgi:hypothetical protein
MKKLAIAICILLTNGLFAAAPISISGQGTASYTNLFGKPDKSVENQAKANAITDAINRALENQSEALREQFKKAGASITLDDYFSKKLITELSTNLLNDDKAEKKITMRFEGKLDLTALRDALNAMPSDKIQKSAVNLSKAEAAIFFTVRMTSKNKVSTGEKSSEANVDANVTATQAKNNESEGRASASDDGVSKSETSLKQAKGKVKAQVSESESSSVTQVADEQTWKLDKASKTSFGNGLMDRFSSKGFADILDGAEFDSAAQLDAAYGAGDDIPAAVWKQIVSEVRESEPSVKYLVVGTLDFSIPTKDPINGLHLMTGKVSGTIKKLEGTGRPRTFAALADIEAKQSAATQQDAKTRVMAILTEKAADDIIAKLRNKDGM